MLMNLAFLKSAMSCRISLGIEYHKTYPMSNSTTYTDANFDRLSATNVGSVGHPSAPLPCRKRSQLRSQAHH